MSNKKDKEIQLIGPPHWYKDDEEDIGSVKPPCRCGECGKPAPEEQWPDPKIEVGDKD